MILFFSDLHIKYGTSRFEDTLNSFSIIQKIVIENKIKNVFILGDVFDNWNPFPIERRIFHNFINSLGGINVYILLGNHDYKEHIGVMNYAMVDYESLRSNSANVTVVISPDIITIGDIDFIMLPHLTFDFLQKIKLNYETAFFTILDKLLKKSKNEKKVILSHVLLKGVFASEEVRAVDKDKLMKYNYPILLGDVHSPTVYRGNPFFGYVGSISRVSFSEFKDTKRIIIFKDNEFRSVNIPTRKYINIEINLKTYEVFIEGEDINNKIIMSGNTSGDIIAFFTNYSAFIKDTVVKIEINGDSTNIAKLDKISILATVKQAGPYFLKAVKFNATNNTINFNFNYKKFDNKNIDQIFAEWIELQKYMPEFKNKFISEIKKICN